MAPDRQPHLGLVSAREYGSRTKVATEVASVVNLWRGLIGVTACAVATATGCGKDPSTAGPSGPAKTNRAKIRVTWRAESAQNVYGFTIYRGPSPQGPWTRVNSNPILAEHGGTTNIRHDYEYIDSDESIALGDACWYWLEAVEHDGTKRPVKWPPKQVIAVVRINEDFPPSEED